MKNKLILVLIFVAGPLCSCNKYLDKKADTMQVVPTTIADFQALLDRSLVMNQVTPSSGIASSDNYYLLPNTYSGLTDNPKKLYTWIPYDFFYENDWSNSYLAVYNANLSLEGLAKIPTATKEANIGAWNNVQGSALFHRAYAFLNLVWIYGKAYDETTSNSDLGIVLRMNSDVNSKSTRASVKQCYDQVIADATAAIEYLPDLPQNVYRPSKVAVNGLLARTYLSMRQYDKALQYAESCLGKQQYLMDYNGDDGINGFTNIGGNTPFRPYQYNKEIIFYSQPNRINGIANPGVAKADTTLFQSYNTDDLRRTAFFRTVSGVRQFKGNYSGSGTILFSGLATDEMYLIRAECYARAGNVSSAMADLNTLMQKRWRNSVPYPVIDAANATEALDKILVERRKELMMRGLRWIDIKRLNKEGKNITLTRKLPDGSQITLSPNANYFALPLPKDIIEITGIQQNPY